MIKGNVREGGWVGDKFYAQEVDYLWAEYVARRDAEMKIIRENNRVAILEKIAATRLIYDELLKEKLALDQKMEEKICESTAAAKLVIEENILVRDKAQMAIDIATQSYRASKAEAVNEFKKQNPFTKLSYIQNKLYKLEQKLKWL